MGNVRASVTIGLFRHLIDGIGMSDGRQNATARKLVGEIHSPFQFGGDAPSHNLVRSLQELHIVLRHRVFQIGWVLSSTSLGREKWTFQVQAKHLSALLVKRAGLFEDIEHPEKLLVGTGKRGRKHRCGAVSRVHLGHPQERLHITVHNVESSASVHVNVHKTRGHIASCGIYDYIRRIRLDFTISLDFQNFTGFNITHGRHSLHDTFRKDELAARNNQFFHYMLDFLCQ